MQANEFNIENNSLGARLAHRLKVRTWRRLRIGGYVLDFLFVVIPICFLGQIDRITAPMMTGERAGLPDIAAFLFVAGWAVLCVWHLVLFHLGVVQRFEEILEGGEVWILWRAVFGSLTALLFIDLLLVVASPWWVVTCAASYALYALGACIDYLQRWRVSREWW